MTTKRLYSGVSLVAQCWESACQCTGHGFELWSGKIPHAPERLGPWATTTEPARLEPVLCTWGSQSCWNHGYSGHQEVRDSLLPWFLCSDGDFPADEKFPGIATCKPDSFPHSSSAPSCPSSWQCGPPRPPWPRQACPAPGREGRETSGAGGAAGKPRRRRGPSAGLTEALPHSRRWRRRWPMTYFWYSDFSREWSKQDRVLALCPPASLSTSQAQLPHHRTYAIIYVD